jgi:hypothetical protein
MWVLITSNLSVYMFKEGYLRTSSQAFDLGTGTWSDLYVHLTNNAVQKYAKDYGKFEEGN